MKLKPSRLRLTIYFIISALILLFVIVGMCFSIFFLEPFGYKQIIILVAWLILSLLWLFFLDKQYFYQVEDKYFSVIKFNKELVYMYDDIIYIDYKYSSTHSNILFITNLGHARYVVHDRNRKLLDILSDRCKKQKDRDSIIRQYPSLSEIIK